MEGTPRLWADIPLELAHIVLGHLSAHIDRVRFAAVCPQWRSAVRQVRLPPPPPLLALKDGTFYSMPQGKPLRFLGCEHGFTTASGNWLVYNRLHCLLLVDPFSRATMTLPPPPNIYVPHNGHVDDEFSSMDAPYSINFVLVKLIVCSPHLFAALFKGGCGFRIAVCRPGASSWSLTLERHMWIFDIAFYQEKLYALNCLMDLLALDITIDDNTGDPQVAQIREVIKCGHLELQTRFQTVFYLVESRDSLLMVRRSIDHGHIHDEGQIHTFTEQCEPELAVFEADIGQSRWAKVTTLGDDQTLFLGPCSRTVFMPLCDSLDRRVWFLDDYKNDNQVGCITGSVTDDMAIRKFSCPLPMISWRAHDGCTSAAMWLFPSN